MNLIDMSDLLLSRTTVIGLAVIGGVVSVLATWCRSRGVISENSIKWLNTAAYTFMFVSIILFISAGLLGTGET